MEKDIKLMKDVCEKMRTFKGDHVQNLAEQQFCKLRNYKKLRYLRGCSGFAGFSKGSFSRSNVEEFSEEMEGVLGKIWLNWGSEQVTSNFIIANSPNACVLPYPKYCNFTSDIPYE